MLFMLRVSGRVYKAREAGGCAAGDRSRERRAWRLTASLETMWAAVDGESSVHSGASAPNNVSTIFSFTLSRFSLSPGPPIGRHSYGTDLALQQARYLFALGSSIEEVRGGTSDDAVWSGSIYVGREWENPYGIGH